MKLLSKEYNEEFHKLGSAKRSLDKARHASLKQLSGAQNVEQFAALGATFCEDLTIGCARQDADHFGTALKECVHKVTLLLKAKEAADLAATPASGATTPNNSPAPAETRIRSSPTALSLQRGTLPSAISTPLSTTSLERSSAPEFGSHIPQLPTASQAYASPLTVFREQAEAHALFLTRQVEAAAKAKLEEFQEHVKQQVASNINTIQEKEE